MIVVSQEAGAAICWVLEGRVENHVYTHTGGSNLILTTLLEISESAFSF